MSSDKTNSPHTPPAFAMNLSKVQLWMPSAVQALETRPDEKVVAVGREDGDIELTVPGEGYRAEVRVPGQKGKGLRSLQWIDRSEHDETVRLFGCGLDGTVFEVDLLRLCYKNVRDVYGGSAWTMRAATALGLLAIGCEDGSVRVFSVEGGGLEYKRSFPSLGSRVLSLAWGPGNDTIYAGCADSMIHCIDTQTGQGMFDMRLESIRSGKVLVWALEALSDGSVVSGDSDGCIQVWDGHTGTQLQSLATHEADVLCLCVSAGETEVFASGCDGKVVCLERQGNFSTPGPHLGDEAAADAALDVDAEGEAMKSSRRRRQGWEWSVGNMRREHTHDVHAMTIHEQCMEGRIEEKSPGAARRGLVLVSGGVDASLALYSVPRFKKFGPRAMNPLPPVPVAFLARSPRLVLVMGNLRLDLWEIPRHSRSFAAGLDSSEEDGTLLDTGEEGNKSPSLRLTLEPKSEKGGHLACAAISPDGGLVAVSNTKETKLYRLEGISSNGPVSARRVRMPGSCSPPAHALAFSPDSARLIVAAAGGDIRIIDLCDDSGTVRPGAIRLTHCFEEHVDGVGPGGGGDRALPVSAVTLSANGKWLVSASASGVVYVFDLADLRHYWTVPCFSEHRTVGLRFHYRDDILVSVDSSNAFRLLDVRNRRLAAFHENVEFPRVPSGRGHWGGQGDVPPLSGVAFNPGDMLHSMLLFNDRSVMYVSLKRKVPSNVLVKTPPLKKPRLGANGKASRTDMGTKAGSHQSNFRLNRGFSSVVLLDFLAENELLVMENPWDSVRESLPNALDRKQYI